MRRMGATLGLTTALFMAASVWGGGQSWAEEPAPTNEQTAKGAEAGATGDDAPYRGVETFLANNQGAAFLTYAQQFLASHPDHPRTPQVLLDMVVCATVLRDTTRLRQIKLEVLLKQPSSVAGAFVIRSTPVDELNAILAERLNLATPPLDGATFRQVATAVETIVRDHGATAHQDLWAVQLLARGEAPTDATLEKATTPHQKLVRLALDPTLSPRDKFVQLQPLAEPKFARSYQQLLYKEQLSDDDRAATEVRIVVIENLLKARHFAAALPDLQSLTATTDEPRLHYFLAWALASQGESAAALETLEALEQRSPDSPWTAAGKSLKPIVSSLDKSLLEHVQQVERMAAALSTNRPEILEFVIARETTSKMRLHWQFDLLGDAFALVAYRDDRMVIAYEVNAKGCQYFVDGDKTVKLAATGGACPIFTFQHHQAPEGGQNHHFHFNTLPQGRFAVMQSMRNLLGLPSLATTQGRIDWLRHSVRSGIFPEPIVNNSGEAKLRWRSLNLESTEPYVTELTVTPDSRLRELDLDGKWRVSEINYGLRDKVALTPIVWPNLPVQTTPNMPVADFMRMFSALTSLATE